MNNKLTKGFILSATGCIGWGISGVCSQYLFTTYNMSAEWLSSIRMIIAGIILLLISLIKDNKKVINIWKNKKDVIRLLCFSIFGLIIAQYAYLGAIKFSNSATATVLQSLNVVIMAIVMAIISKKGFRLPQIISIVLAIAGTALIATKGNISNINISYLGLILGLLAAVGVVVYTLLAQSIISTWGNLNITGWGMLIGGLFLFVITGSWYIPQNLDITAILIILVIIIIGTVIAFTTFLEGAKYIGPQKATLIGCLEPASATVLSTLVLKTEFNIFELIGFCLIMATVFICVLSKEKGDD